MVSQALQYCTTDYWAMIVTPVIDDAHDRDAKGNGQHHHTTINAKCSFLELVSVIFQLCASTDFLQVGSSVLCI